jgi:uncharacterized membrane protein
MKTVRINAMVATAVSALIAGAALAQTHPEKPTYKYEKCYGVAQAGKNDCFFAANSCAGTLTRERDPAAWIYVPKGTCQKIAGGTIEPPAGSP